MLPALLNNVPFTVTLVKWLLSPLVLSALVPLTLLLIITRPKSTLVALTTRLANAVAL